MNQLRVWSDYPACGLVAGQWAQQVTHPSAGITREYVATLDAAPTRKQLQTIAEGACMPRSWLSGLKTTHALQLTA